MKASMNNQTQFFLPSITKRIKRKIQFLFTFYVRCRADLVEYLRFQGVKIGQGCNILTSPHNFGTEPWLIEIGDHVTISYGVQFITHDGTSRLFRNQLSGSTLFGERFGTIVIRDNCFIGTNAILLPDIEIGPDAAVGAGSVVTKSIPPRMIAAGNPAGFIKTLDEYIDDYQQGIMPIQATDRDALRKELTKVFWGSGR